MKLILPLLFALFASAATAQNFSIPVRYFNGRPVTVQPVFAWWTNAEALNLKNKRLSKTKQVALPERVMPAWVRISSTEITNVGGGLWVARAGVQEAPGGPVKTLVVSLRHGPFVEIAKFQTAARDWAAATAARSGAYSSFTGALENKAAAHRSASFYSELNMVAPRSGFQTASRSYSRSAAASKWEAEQASRRMASLDAVRGRADDILKGRTVFLLEDFALRTGEVYAGLPVFDLGLPIGR